jgi:hypothetical protein
MIRKKDFYQIPGRIRALLAGIAAIALANAAQAASPDAPQALDLITNTADRICNVVSTKGEIESTQVNGQVKAELSGLASRLANVGISGSGSINNEQYQNVLRQDLAATLHDNAQCKLKVFEDLQVKLIPEASTERTIPPNVDQPIAWADAISFASSGDAMLGLLVAGRVVNPVPVQLIDAYVISDITGERKTLQVGPWAGCEQASGYLRCQRDTAASYTPTLGDLSTAWNFPLRASRPLGQLSVAR